MKSIKTRLTLFYTLAAFILLSVVALLLYWITINILYKADYQFLADEVDTIQYILENKPVDLVALKQAVIEIPTQHDHSIYNYYTRVFDENNRIIIQTPGMADVLNQNQFLNNKSEFLGKKRYLWYSKNDNNYLLLQAPIKLKNNHYGIIQVALDISYQHNIISDRKKLVYVLLIGTLLSLILGFLIAHRGMRSLYLLTDAVQRITITSLHERINPKSWPKELSGLGLAFNQMLDRIEASFIRLKQFSDDLSHELRTPITNLIGETEIALSYAHSVNEYRQIMESNLEELHRVSSLIENILFLARAENPQINLHKTLLSVHDEIAMVFEYYQAMTEEKNIHISYSGQANIEANSVMFRRMISNILSNALKHTPDGGWVRFNIKKIDNNMVKISAMDNGVGIGAEHLPKIFDRFYRIESCRSQKMGGTGLGLAIVKSIVLMHEGAISISSEPGKGTILTITMPSSSKTNSV